MSATETAMSALERNWGMVDKALEDLDDVMFGERPNDESNSIGWLLFHMTRIVDRFVHTWCQDAPQLWANGGWHEKFGLDDDPNNTGQGWTKEQLEAWPLPAKDTVLGYYEAVKTAAREYFGSMLSTTRTSKMFFILISGKSIPRCSSQSTMLIVSSECLPSNNC